jgi:SulP family sulfate permease
MLFLTLLFLTPLFTDLPQTVLAAVVLAAIVGLFDWKEMLHIASVKRSDAFTMMIAFVATLVLGVELGMAVAIAASIAVLVARVMNPHSAELGHLPGTAAYRNLQRFSNAERLDGLGLLRIDVSVNFANVAFLKKRLRALEADHPEGLRAIVLDGAGINDLDASGVAALEEILDDYEGRGIAVHLANMKGPVRDVLIRSGLWQRLGDHVHVDMHQAVQRLTDAAATSPDRIQAGIDERG